MFILKQDFSQSLQILQDGIVTAENLNLIAYSKFFKMEIKRINLLSPLHQSSQNNPTVAKIMQIQEISQLIDLFSNFLYRLSII